MTTTERRRAYIAKYNLERYHKRMAEAVALLGGSCIVCGETEDLQLDHRDPDSKSFNVGKLWSLSQETFLEELTKCQLLCDPCHKAKTLTFDQKKIQAKKGNTTGIKNTGARRRTGILTQRRD
jgi:5-methylcytosine-specific restriction endonuclease McrA